MEGFIYLIRLREFVNDNRNVYKLGMTTREFIKRMQQYSAKSVDEVYIKYYVDDCKYVESELKKIFNNTFIVMRDYGKEYYCGDVWEMVNTIHNYIMDNNHYIDDSNNFKHVKINKKLKDRTYDDRTCYDCFEIFKSITMFNKHMLNKKNNKKMILHVDNFKCDLCGTIFFSESSMCYHKLQSCDEIKIEITSEMLWKNYFNDNLSNNLSNNLNDNLSNNPNDNQINSNISIKNINSSNKYINFKTAIEHINPTTEFEDINNIITINNLEKYLAEFDEKLYIFPESIANLLNSILFGKYIKNTLINKRNIFTINCSCKMYYYKNNRWIDDCDEYFTNCIKKLLNQLQDVVINKMSIIDQINENDIIYLKKHDFTMEDKELNRIVYEKIRNIENNESSKNDDLSYMDLLKSRSNFYFKLYSISREPIIIEYVLASMKEKLRVDNELRAIIANIPQLVN